LYKKNTIGILLTGQAYASINTLFIKGYNIYQIDMGLGISYFFKNRWSLNSNIQYNRNFTNRPDLFTVREYVYGETSLRYHLRNWYFGGGMSAGNFPFLGVFLGDLPPRTTVRAFLGAGLHVRTSPYKKFWKNTFFVIDLQVGKSLYVEPKPDQFSTTDGIRPSGHIGLHYLIPRKK
jgi:hypothetical protein